MAHRKSMMSLPQNLSVAELQGLSGPLPSNSATRATLPPVEMKTVPVATVSNAAHASSLANGETRPRVVNPNHPAFTSSTPLPGTMNLAIVAMSRPNPAFLTSREEKKMLGGVAVADLRRMVIDKMVSSGGWVVNDFIREVNGNRVFIVTARTPKDALTPEKAWTFYFTEAGGRIYGLTTDAPVEYAERMTNEAQRFIESLRAKAEAGSR